MPNKINFFVIFEFFGLFKLGLFCLEFMIKLNVFYLLFQLRKSVSFYNSSNLRHSIFPFYSDTKSTETQAARDQEEKRAY